jgi:hypothetical protein
LPGIAREEHKGVTPVFAGVAVNALLTRQSILFAKRLYAKRVDRRIIRAFTPVFVG